MIVIYPDPILRKKCRWVEQVDEELRATIVLLQQELLRSQIGVGLSAPQVGRDQRVFVMKKPTQPSEVSVLINPEIIDTFGAEKVYPKIRREDGQEELFLEGCLSFPNLYGPVRRWLKIEVRYQKLDQTETKLKPVTAVLENFEAIVFQHELDHLDGILFIDHLKKDQAKLYRQEKGKLKEISLASLLIKAPSLLRGRRSSRA